MKRKIHKETLNKFKEYLKDSEKSRATVEKYVRDISVFCSWISEKKVDKNTLLKYKEILLEKYAPASVNSIISSLNSFFSFAGWHELKVKNIKIQRQIFSSEEREITKEEYQRLLQAAKQKKDERMYLLMQTICSTGIRVSELKYITVESVNSACAEINCKGKRRIVFFPVQLCKLLKKYTLKARIKKGPIFITRNGNPLDRSNIWSEMKKLCKLADVSEKKVFPHNLRHLFARTYYAAQKDVVRLADILGHSSVNTTRIYTMESGDIHRKQIQNLGLLLC